MPRSVGSRGASSVAGVFEGAEGESPCWAGSSSSVDGSEVSGAAAGVPAAPLFLCFASFVFFGVGPSALPDRAAGRSSATGIGASAGGSSPVAPAKTTTMSSGATSPIRTMRSRRLRNTEARAPMAPAAPAPAAPAAAASCRAIASPQSAPAASAASAIVSRKQRARGDR
ncbi:MAG TPA: hypothetical protein VI122_15735 [Thermoleophilaceae bacterium]